MGLRILLQIILTINMNKLIVQHIRYVLSIMFQLKAITELKHHLLLLNTLQCFQISQENIMRKIRPKNADNEFAQLVHKRQCIFIPYNL